MTARGATFAVPASIGNLGPGFDTLGLAVRLFLRIRVRRLARDGRGRLQCRFLSGAPQGPNRIEEGFRALATGRPRRLPSIEIDVENEIPMRAGLGSSAAATVAGLRLFALAAGRRPREEMLAAACRIEGHPDNAAAALYGGLTSSCAREDGTVSVARWRWPRALRVIVATPALPLDTAKARRALPPRVPLGDAVFNLQRVVLLLRSLEAGDFGRLREALDDRLHQPFRAPLIPGLARALASRHPDLLGVCLSGAGPSVVGFARENHRGVARALAHAYRMSGVACDVRTLSVHARVSV
jgi:homoserine kinase